MKKNATYSHRHPHNCCMSKACEGMTRREFMSGVSIAAGGLAMSSLGWASLGFSDEMNLKPAPPVPLKVQPVLTCTLPKRKKKTSWRAWGGFHTQKDITDEKQRIGRELKKILSESEFPLKILPLVTLNSTEQAAKVAQGGHDVLLLYAANSWVNVM